MLKLGIVAAALAVAVWMPLLLSAAGIALMAFLVVAPSLAGSTKGIAAG